jgi:hypothetical protein
MQPGTSTLAQRSACVHRATSLRTVLLAAALAAVPIAGVCSGAAAQSYDAPRISVAPRIMAEAETPAPIRIEVEPRGAVPPQSFVNLRGLPPSVGLTEGHSIAPGAWAVPLNGLPGLRAYIPPGLAGESVITINLLGVDGRLLAAARTTLVIQPRTAARVEPTPPPVMPAPAMPPQAMPPQAMAPAAAQLPRLAGQDLIEAETLLKRGIDALENGRVEIARQFYLRAAEKGLPAAAMRLGATYDPAELGRLKAQGVVPDLAQARKWYERARALGAPDASERLARLGGGS